MAEYLKCAECRLPTYGIDPAYVGIECASCRYLQEIIWDMDDAADRMFYAVHPATALERLRDKLMGTGK